jgi:hypothetical protein
MWRDYCAATINLAGRVASPYDVTQAPHRRCTGTSLAHCVAKGGQPRQPPILLFDRGPCFRFLIDVYECQALSSLPAAFFCSTAPQAFFRPDRGIWRPPRAEAVKAGPSLRRRGALRHFQAAP